MTQAEALTILKTGANVFLTGEPGAGKSYTINEYVRYLRGHGIEPAITASTGIAATHIGGMTIHSWSGIGIHHSLDMQDIRRVASAKHIGKRIRETNVLIIDEVSMLAPKTLDMVEAVCREARQSYEPFGGLQVILVGDFFQLPPIIKRKTEEDPDQIVLLDEPEARFSYDSSAWTRSRPIICYLSEQHRQDDKDYLGVLSAIRNNTFSMKHVAHVEKRRTTYDKVPTDAPKLFSHNVDVDLVNNDMLSQLPGEVMEFPMRTYGPSPLVATLIKGCLSPEFLNLKIGASVMFTKNNPRGGFVNGTLGTVEGFREDDNYPMIRTRHGRLVTAEPMEWGISEGGVSKATITQFPLRLAWAITVHKSQGMSLDEAVMDLSDVFEYGQGYVALSRVRRLAGVHLIGWNQRAFQVHPDVITKEKEFQLASATSQEEFANMPEDEVQKRQVNFILKCDGSLEALSDEEIQKPNEQSLGEKIDTHTATLTLWKEGKTIPEIAEARGLKERTIFDHVEELIKIGDIKQEELLRLVTPELKKALPKIQSIFAELDTDKLTPVYEEFDGMYSYDDIRLARMMIEK
ncbi:MAG: helix-turn-helix domain-containing protein [Candidatus Pacebacteria bacterium]|nr:helix-turn-helix domain-containing protein [Candidatus Paceibacterota bacterium]